MVGHMPLEHGMLVQSQPQQQMENLDPTNWESIMNAVDKIEAINSRDYYFDINPTGVKFICEMRDKSGERLRNVDDSYVSHKQFYHSADLEDKMKPKAEHKKLAVINVIEMFWVWYNIFTCTK